MMSRILITAALAIFISEPAASQTLRTFSSPADSLASAAAGTFTSKDGGFGIALPARFSGFSGAGGVEFKWRLKEGSFIAGVTERAGDIENSRSFDIESGKIIDVVYENLVRDNFESPVEIEAMSAKEIAYRGRRGRETRFVLKNAVIVIRVFWQTGRAYKVGVLLAGEQKQFESAALNVFDSMTYLKFSEIEAEDERIIRERSPTDLPQSPRPAKLGTDRILKFLNGRVKRVVTFREVVRGTGAGGPKTKIRDELFDEVGMLIKAVGFGYNTGRPQSIVVYGFIDGSRVQDSEWMDSDGALSAISTSSERVVEKKRDPRFDYRHEYRFDDKGRVVEDVLIDGAGDTVSRTTYEYGAGTVDEKRYFSGKLNQHYRTTLDAAGNEIEHRSLPVVGMLTVSVFRIEQTDSNTNWTRRFRTLYRQVGDALEEQSATIETREIAYY